MKALIFGASGLVGGFLLQELLEADTYLEVVSLGRSVLPIEHKKLKQVAIDFEQLEKYQSYFKTDAVFCCLGTTIGKAGSKEAFSKVDYFYPLNIFRLAEEQGVIRLIVVSSIGANAHSSNFYLRTKGQMEEELLQSSIPLKAIVRPSMLLGPRKEFRFGETIGKAFMKIFNFMMVGRLAKYSAIKAEEVAIAMMVLSYSTEETRIVLSEELKEIARSYND